MSQIQPLQVGALHSVPPPRVLEAMPDATRARCRRIHNTAFGTRWLNKSLAHLVGFFVFRGANWYWYFHWYHHRVRLRDDSCSSAPPPSLLPPD